MAKKKVFIGVGHGGSDPGAVANNFKEKDLNLSIAIACQAELARHGVSVLMSRTKDENDDLSEEIRECNAFNPDLAVDIHNNAGGGDGAEAFYHHGGGTGKTLANNILAEVVKIGQNSRGAKIKKNASGKDYFGFIRNTVAPAVIVECALVDNKKDIQIIDTAAEQKAFGVAIAKGILKTLGISYIAEAVKPVTDGKTYRVQVFAGSKAGAEATAKKLNAAGFSAIIV
jgi:N-acetylmuramoyl-L-alanine amidase